MFVKTSYTSPEILSTIPYMKRNRKTPFPFAFSNCGCSSHLFGFEVVPLNLKEFHGLLNWFRMDGFFQDLTLLKINNLNLLSLGDIIS